MGQSIFKVDMMKRDLCTVLYTHLKRLLYQVTLHSLDTMRDPETESFSHNDQCFGID